MILWLRALGWLFTPVAPLLAAAMARGPLGSAAWRRDVRTRLGFPPDTLAPGSIVVHGASLGEARACGGVIATLRQVAPDAEVLRSSTRAIALDVSLPEETDARLVAPLDLPVAVDGWLARVRPAAVIVLEGDLWPVMIAACAAHGIPVLVAGARVGRGTARWVRAFPRLAASLRWLPRDDPDAASFAGMLPAHAIGRVVGDPKLYGGAVAMPSPWGSRPAFVAGCTHPGEERLVLAAWRRRDALLVLAPRKVARAGAVVEDARVAGWRARPWSSLHGPVPTDVDVLVVDRIGPLAGMYAHARGAFIGGTLTPVGDGHSPAEAMAAGLPVVRGPHARGPAWAACDASVVLDADELAVAIAAFLDRQTARRSVTMNMPLADELRTLADAPAAPDLPLRPWMAPMAALWGLGQGISARRAAPRAPIPVVAVGGLAAGGSGKTPVCTWLAQAMATCQPVVVSRGHGRAPGGDVRVAGEARWLGDEAAMLARRGIHVATAPNRLAAILRARETLGAKLAILDDGWTTRSVRADLHILVIDAARPLAGGLIPVGGRRLPVTDAARADVCLVLDGKLDGRVERQLRPDALVVTAERRASAWTRRGEALPVDAFRGRRAVAFAGIAHPSAFFRACRRAGVILDRTWAFADHHVYDWTDLQTIEAWLDTHLVLTTEKDAARLPSDASPWVLRSELHLPEGGAALVARIAQLIGGA